MTTKHKSEKKIKRWPFVLGLAIVIVGLAAWRIHTVLAPSDHLRGTDPALAVDAVRVTRQAVPLTLHAAGTVETIHSVAVRAQVSGVLGKVLFKEGDQVKAGQLLFVIDPRPYQAQVDQAKGQLAQDQAKLVADRANEARFGNLVKQGYVSSQDWQNAQAQVGQDEGLIASDKAKLAEALLLLGHTRIEAPISGRTGSLAYKTGNLIEANDTTPLVTINQIAPILVQFDIPQSEIGTLLRYRDDPALDIFVRSPDDQLITAGGKLVFIDNAVNNSAGTLAVKAGFSNAEQKLWPGELVHVGLRLTIQRERIAIPVAAVQPGQQGDYVYVVNGGKAEVRNVQVERHYEGFAIIESGLAVGDRVIVRIPRDLRDGLAVNMNMLPDVVVAADLGTGSRGAAAATAVGAPHARS